MGEEKRLIQMKISTELSEIGQAMLDSDTNLAKMVVDDSEAKYQLGLIFLGGWMNCKQRLS